MVMMALAVGRVVVTWVVVWDSREVAAEGGGGGCGGVGVVTVVVEDEARGGAWSDRSDRSGGGESFGTRPEKFFGGSWPERRWLPDFEREEGVCSDSGVWCGGGGGGCGSDDEAEGGGGGCGGVGVVAVVIEDEARGGAWSNRSDRSGGGESFRTRPENSPEKFSDGDWPVAVGF
ncbi:hypothetical protein Tco_0435258 [Tanacetum coccineum]